MATPDIHTNKHRDRHRHIDTHRHKQTHIDSHTVTETHTFALRRMHTCRQTRTVYTKTRPTAPSFISDCRALQHFQNMSAVKYQVNCWFDILQYVFRVCVYMFMWVPYMAIWQPKDNDNRKYVWSLNSRLIFHMSSNIAENDEKPDLFGVLTSLTRFYAVWSQMWIMWLDEVMMLYQLRWFLHFNLSRFLINCYWLRIACSIFQILIYN